jgi:hypothetical protein
VLERWGERLFSPRMAWVVALGTVSLIIAGVPASLLAHQRSGAWLQFPLLLPFTIVGLVVARRQPRNAVAWLLLAIAALFVISNDASAYSLIAFKYGHPGLPLARFAAALTQTWIGLLLLLPLVIFLFPDGRLPSPRWRWSLWLYAAAAVLFVAGIAVKDIPTLTAHHVVIDSSGEPKALNGSHDSGIFALTSRVLLLVYLGSCLTWIVHKIIEVRRSTGERRQQFKWVIAGGAVGVFGFALALSLSNSGSVIAQVAGKVGFFAVIAVPISIGVGILRYRLYDVDRIISRTVSYAVVTGLLVGVYVGLVTLATRVLPLTSQVGVAAATLVAAALFTPLRRRMQGVVDHRFNRTKYDGRATVAAFNAGLRDTVDLTKVEQELVAAVHRSLEPRSISLWLNQQEA